MGIDLTRQVGENEEKYLWRLGSAKESGMIDLSWGDIADLMNKYCRADEDEYYSEAAYRKPFQQAKRFFDSGVFSQTEDEYIDALKTARQELSKERTKIRDERTALNRELREQGRRESMYEIVKRAFDTYKGTEFEYIPSVVKDSDCDVIIHLTDIHCGLEIDSTFNKFNSDILKKRLDKFLDEIYDIKKLYNPEKAYLILGGDFIHGIIHLNCRLESKEDLVQQIMTCSDMVSYFVYELSKMFKKVEVHTVVGNHSRSFPNKEDSSHAENFDLLIPFVGKRTLSNIKNVEFKDNYIDCGIANFMVRGHSVFAAHGDKDTAKTVVYNMTKMARKAKVALPDMCYLGHRHTNGLTTVDDVKVIESGCVDGMDSYCIEERLTGTPEQTVTVVTEKKMIKALCDIQID